MAETYKIDASNKVLGRLAAETVVFLRGKNNPNFAPNKISGNKVIIFNTSKIVFTGKKIKNKIYRSHSGYPGGVSEITLGEMIKKDPSEPLRRAVYDMLPKNKLRAKLIKNLELHAGEIK